MLVSYGEWVIVPIFCRPRVELKKQERVECSLAKLYCHEGL